MLYTLVSKIQNFTHHKTHNIIHFPCVLLESPNILFGKWPRHNFDKKLYKIIYIF